MYLLTDSLSRACTNPPALAYASEQDSESDKTSVAYATVYPLSMFLMVLTAQLLILFLAWWCQTARRRWTSSGWSAMRTGWCPTRTSTSDTEDARLGKHTSYAGHNSHRCYGCDTCRTEIRSGRVSLLNGAPWLEVQGYSHIRYGIPACRRKTFIRQVRIQSAVSGAYYDGKGYIAIDETIYIWLQGHPLGCLSHFSIENRLL